MHQAGGDDLVSDLPIDELAGELLGPVSPMPLNVGAGSIRPIEGDWRGRKVLAAVFDPSHQQGSIGRDEADQLTRMMRLAAPDTALVLVMNTSGIRVTDGVHGIASLRRLLREAEEARLRGVRMLSLIVRQTFGGASLLAALCERRIVHTACLFAMSGPRLIASAAACGSRDDAAATAIRDAISGGARAAVSSEFVCVPDRVSAFRSAMMQWLDESRPDPFDRGRLVAQGQKLAARLLMNPSSAGQTTAAASLLDDAALHILAAIDRSGWDYRRAESVIIAGPRTATGVVALALMARDGCSYRDALALALQLLEIEGNPGSCRHVVIIVDSESHAASLPDERCILSEALAFLALVIRWMSRRGIYVRVIVSGLAGGGIQGALGSAANSVAMAPGARLRVLPKAAMAALRKSEDDESGCVTSAMMAGAVDGEFSCGAVRQEEMVHVRQ